MSEKWKLIEGFPHYAISDQGRVLSRKSGEWKFLSPYPDKQGYLIVALITNKKRKMAKVHRLVAQAFIPNPLELPEVNHLNGDKKDNRASELEWATRGSNMIHAVKLGLLGDKKGTNNPNYDPTIYTFYHPEHGTIKATQYELVRLYKLNRPNINNLLKGRQGHHKGWRLV